MAINFNSLVDKYKGLLGQAQTFTQQHPVLSQAPIAIANKQFQQKIAQPIAKAAPTWQAPGLKEINTAIGKLPQPIQQPLRSGAPGLQIPEIITNMVNQYGRVLSGKGTPSDIAFTALDVLPFVGGGIKSIRGITPLLRPAKKVSPIVASKAVKGAIGGVGEGIEALASEARKYKSAEEFINDYQKINREVKIGLPSINKKALGEFTDKGKIIINPKGLSKGEIREVIAHERRHSIDEKIMDYFMKFGKKGFDKELDKALFKVKQMGMVTGLSGKGELSADILEQFVYNNKQFKKELPELHKYLSNFFSLRKQTTKLNISQLTDIWNKANKTVEKTRMGIVPNKQLALGGKAKSEVLTQATKESPFVSSPVIISQKGKLNVKKLNLTDEQKLVIQELQKENPVTVVSNKQVKEASKLTQGRTIEMTDEEQLKRISQALNSRQDVVSLSRKLSTVTSEKERVEIMKQIAEKSRIAQQEGTFAGRLLQARNILADETATPIQRVLALLDNAGIKEEKYIKDAAKIDWNDGKQVVEFYRKYVPPSFGEILTEIRYTNMLSSPQTHLVNIFGNFIQTGLIAPVEKTISGTIGKLAGKEGYSPTQGVAYAKGYWSKLPQAFKAFKDTVSGKSINIKPDLERIPTSAKGPLYTYTTPLRALEGMDQFFKTLGISGEMEALKAGGVTGTEALKRAEQDATYRLFRQAFDPDGKLGQGYVLQLWDKWNTAIKSLRRAPGGNWIIPFLQTPTNILKQGLEYSPLGITTIPGAKQPIEQLSKAIIGSTVFLGAYQLASNGKTTWGVPTDPKEKDLFYASGRQPYAVKIGDKWVSYSKLGPLSYPIAMAAAYNYVSKQNPDQGTIERLQEAFGQVAKFFSDQSYVKNLGDMVDTITRGGFNVPNIISSEAANILGQLIPYRSFMGWLTRLVDPVYRNADTLGQKLAVQIPGLSQTVPAYTNEGVESRRDFPILNALSPVKVTQEKQQYVPQLEARQEKLIENKQLNAAEKKVEQSQEEVKVGNKIVYFDPETKSPKTIELNKVFTKPKLTGDMVADKALISKYNSSISTQISHLTDYYNAGKMIKEEYTKAINELNKTKIIGKKKGKKPSFKIKVVKVPKIKLAKVKKISIKKPKTLKKYVLKVPKIKTSKIKKTARLS